MIEMSIKQLRRTGYPLWQIPRNHVQKHFSVKAFLVRLYVQWVGLIIKLQLSASIPPCVMLLKTSSDKTDKNKHYCIIPGWSLLHSWKGLTAVCPAGDVSTFLRNRLIQQQAVNRQWGRKLVDMGSGCLRMLLRERNCHSNEVIFAEVSTGST